MKDQHHPGDPVASAVNVLTLFFRHLDERNYDGMADLLDGAWHRRGKVLDSRESLLAALADRSPTMRIAHLLTNCCGTLRADGGVDVLAYMLVVRHDDGTSPDGPAPLDGLAVIRTLRCTARPGPDGWRIAYLKSDAALFERQG